MNKRFQVQFDDTTLQSSYAVLDSMEEAMKLLNTFCENLASESSFTFNRRHGIIIERKKSNKQPLGRTGRLLSAPTL